MVSGFNHNLTYRGIPLHIQSEDKGVATPEIVSLIFRGGEIVASVRTSYADILKIDHLPQVVEELMKEQHKGLLRRLKGGEFDRRLFPAGGRDLSPCLPDPGTVSPDQNRSPEVPGDTQIVPGLNPQIVATTGAPVRDPLDLAVEQFFRQIPNMGDNRGFTLIGALMVVVISGIMLGMAGQSWKTVMQREREEELLFRGQQIRNAITHWYTPRAGEHAATPLQSLRDLLEDPRSTGKTRYLRRLYTDPMTGKEWNVIADPAKGIRGVFSTSTAQPFKVAGFPTELKTLEGKKSYQDWKFEYVASRSGSSATGSKSGSTAINPATGLPYGVTPASPNEPKHETSGW